jgi:hypothetical protein
MIYMLGENLFTPYSDQNLESRCSDMFNNLANSNSIGMNSLSSLMAEVSIMNRTEKEPEKTLREYGSPTRHASRKPIRVPDVEVEEFEIITELIIKI